MVVRGYSGSVESERKTSGDGYNGIRTCADENVWCLHCKCSSRDSVIHFLKILSLVGLNKGYKRFLFFLLSYNRSWPQLPLPLLLHVPPSTAILCNSCSNGMSIYYYVKGNDLKGQQDGSWVKMLSTSNLLDSSCMPCHKLAHSCMCIYVHTDKYNQKFKKNFFKWRH